MTFLASFMGGIASSMGHSAIAGTASGPIGRGADFVGNYLFPNALASWNDLHRAWSYGYINWAQLQVNARVQGIALGADVAPKGLEQTAEAWENVAMAMLPRPDTMAVFSAMVHGIFDDKDLNWIVGKYKFPGDYMQHLQDVFRSYWTTLDVMTLANREYISGEDVIKAYSRAGAYLDRELKGYEELRKAIPPIQDLIRFTVKEALNPDMVQRLELMAEVGEADLARHWAARQGLADSILYTEGVPIERTNWFDAYWAAHWQNAAPGQLADMKNKLRPERIFRYIEQVPGIKPFTDEDYEIYMKANDYTPPVRKWLAGIALRTPRLIDTRNEYFEDIIDRNELIELQLDQGYTRVDAEKFARLADKQRERYKYKHRVPPLDKYDNAFIAELLKGFRNGSIPADELLARLLNIYKSVEVASTVLQTEQTRKRNELINQAIRTIKRSFMTGEVSTLEAFDRLASAGIIDDEAVRLVDLWEMSFDMPRKQVTAAKLINWVVMGTMPIGELQSRLLTLGYSERDVANMLAETMQKRLIQLKKDAEQQRKDDKKRSGGKSGDGERWRTPSVISKWAREGLLPTEDAIAYLESIDVPKDDIPLWLSGELG